MVRSSAVVAVADFTIGAKSVCALKGCEEGVCKVLEMTVDV